MFYVIKIALAYPDDTNPRALQAHADTLKHQATTLNPLKPNEEKGYISLEKCYHDEDPTKPCEVLSFWETPTA